MPFDFFSSLSPSSLLRFFFCCHLCVCLFFFSSSRTMLCAVKRIARPCEVCVAGVTHTPHLSCVKVRRIFRLSLNNKIITIAPCAREAIKRKGAEKQKQKKPQIVIKCTGRRLAGVTTPPVLGSLPKKVLQSVSAICDHGPLAVLKMRSKLNRPI